MLNTMKINDKTVGNVKEYHQDRQKRAWVFTLLNDIIVSIPFNNIKKFNSSNGIELILEIFS